jgi:hypothetical protein
VNPRTGLDDVKNRKFLTHLDSNSDPSVVPHVPSRYTDYAIPAPHVGSRIKIIYIARRPSIQHVFVIYSFVQVY